MVVELDITKCSVRYVCTRLFFARWLHGLRLRHAVLSRLLLLLGRSWMPLKQVLSNFPI